METEKVLGALLQSPWSTSAELAAATRVNERTVMTVLQRHCAVLDTQTRSVRRAGRPPFEYRIKDAWRPTIEKRMAPTELSADPLVAAIEIVESAESAWLEAEDDRRRQRILNLARIQSDAARAAIASYEGDTSGLEMRLVNAEARLTQVCGAETLPEPIQITAAFAAAKAAAARPPHSAWKNWLDRLKEFGRKFDASWVPPNEPAPSTQQPAPVAVVIDAIPHEPDSLSAEVVSTLQESGTPILSFPAKYLLLESATRRQFFRELHDLTNDPISCLAPLYVTLDSRLKASKEIWELLEQLGGKRDFGRAVKAAREGIIEAARARGCGLGEIGDHTAFYSAFITNAVAAHAHGGGSPGFWSACRGPALLDVGEDDRLESRMSRLNCMYLGHAGDENVDLKRAVVKWINTSPLSSVGEPMQAFAAASGHQPPASSRPPPPAPEL